MIVIYIPPQASKAPAITAGIAEAIRSLEGSIPVALTYMSSKSAAGPLQAGDMLIPTFAFPEGAAIAMAHACAYGRWRTKPEGIVPRFADVRTDEAHATIASALGRGVDWLNAEEVERLLSCYGLPVARSERAATPEEAGDAAARIARPVALKAMGPDIVHKTEMGAVQLGLEGPDAVRTAARAMSERITASGSTVDGFLVQEMVEGGTEMLVGVAHDPQFGPVVAVSAGGTAVELMRDVAVRVTPITDLDASEMVSSLRTYPLLTGFRGAPNADVDALEEIILRVGALVDAHPSVAEMDCNPVMVLSKGAVIVDARIRVEAAPHEKPLSARGIAAG
jgi:acyl-CoA synthetase (NDP forming)